MITAKEANDLVKAGREAKATQCRERVFNAIREAALSGKTEVEMYPSASLVNDLKHELNELGYSVEVKSTGYRMPNLLYMAISWSSV